MAQSSEVLNLRVPKGYREKFRRLALLAQAKGRAKSQGEFLQNLLDQHEEELILEDTSSGFALVAEEDPVGDAYAAL